ncbi:Histidine kinase [Ekhidna lutea]|uniref:Histidine kinase n=1 Tax=Ekhidna lutea TaxID=447679 RepID=A0A239F7L5_EKHLU|nr:histidine kinase [Ekhidna lutea]SNS52142.1 Histidine kinase [Ekhidna lutea]
MKAVFFIAAFLIMLITSAQDQSSSEFLNKLDSFSTSNLDSAITHSAYIIQEIEGSENAFLKNEVLIKLAYAFINFNSFSKADSVANLVEDPLGKVDQIHLHRIRGRILNERLENDKALVQLYKALELSKINKIEQLVPEIYFELAGVLRENNDLKNCTQYYRFAIEKAQEIKNLDLEVRAYIQMCKVYNGWITLDLDSSVYYGEKAINVSKEADYEFGYANAISIASAPIIRKGEFRRGLELSKEALNYADKYNFSLKTRYYLVLNQAFAYQELGKYDSALSIMEVASKMRPQSFDHFRLKYLVYKDQGNYKSALEAYEAYKAKTDSVQRRRNESKLSTLEAKFDSNLKDQELKAEKQLTSLQKAELDQQRYLIFGMVVIVFLLVVALALVYRQRKLKKQKTLSDLELAETQKLLDLERQYRASELKALRSQMNPHFVFNALNSIQEYIMTNERKLAGKYLGKFADLMRIYLQHSQVKTVTIREETEALNLYLELEKLRFEDSLTYSINIGDNVNTEQLIPSLLLQPYVENAVKHGLLHKELERVLTINIKSDHQEVLICEIIDNGVGRKKSQEINKMRNPGHKSFATQATTNRLGLLNLDREKPIEEEVFDLVDEKGNAEGTKVIIRIPLAMEAQSDPSEVGTQKVID